MPQVVLFRGFGKFLLKMIEFTLSWPLQHRDTF